MSLFRALTEARALRTLDHALAHSLRRLDPATPDVVLAAAALASLAVSRGHAGLKLAAARDLVDGDVVIDWPAEDTWQAELAASRWVATPDDPAAIADTATPLVLEDGLLYLRRYREYERQLVAGLHRIGSHALPGVALEPLVPLFGQLFPDVHAGDDRQARAAALALRHPLLLVTGGPGTGKTTTTARLLVLLAAQARQSGRKAPVIKLAAPTGRAAERMAESVRHAVRALVEAGVDPALLGTLPVAGETLHRLLGTLPGSPRFRHHADEPLQADVVVVDEASMIDLPLMAKLVDAIATGTRLVLLGDPDQLPSVEAGDVLGGILAAAGDGESLSQEDAQALRPLLLTSVETSSASPEFPGVRVHLQRGWRQSEALHLAPLADAVRQGGVSAQRDLALSLLRGGTLSGVHFHEDATDPLQIARDALLAHWHALAEAATPAEALVLASRLRLLTALREGAQGALSLNARIEDLLAGAHRRERHFHGQPILITENHYPQRLFNGDIGICHRDANGTLMAWFPGEDPQHPRALHLAALPRHESAFAMTVHKAQGSEFDTVWLLLPARPNRVLSRELVYTGITRARRALHVAGNETVIREALARHASRWSGLGWRLGVS